MAEKQDRSSPMKTKHRESDEQRNQSTETRTEGTKSKKWIVALIVIVFLLIILAIAGVVPL